MIELETTCRRCGREWQPDHSDYLRDTWRVCPRCRDGPDPQGIQRHVDHKQTRTEAPDASHEESNAA